MLISKQTSLLQNAEQVKLGFEKIEIHYDSYCFSSLPFQWSQNSNMCSHKQSEKERDLCTCDGVKIEE